MRYGAAEPGPLAAAVDGLDEVADDALEDELEDGAALAVLGALGAVPVDAPDEAVPDEAELPLSLGGRTATPPLLPFEGAAAEVVPLDGVPLVEVEALPDVPLLEPEADALEDPLVPVEPLADDVEGDVVEDEAAGGAELCVVALCAGGVLVRVLCPTGKNDPPVMSVAMMPAITATRAIPISRSGQLRRSQSMVPF